ncbi:cysteine-rich receptor-like protein kinase 18 [Mangifera indica]|uniref:cysteine-rich receptor-like protein kinase 18 n=1 Tax=Mangifera indica TaxID=29780 RepID=UPI001CFBE89E|nr:cysteine-rich receptor-like protein kinase 18 [Mangifera indica]
MKMQMGFTVLLILVSILLINIGSSRATICYDTGNFTTNSTYEKNRNLILSSLASNVTLHEGFFYNASIGEEPDKVYALVNCRGDASAEECASCVSDAAKDILNKCLNQKEAVAWGGSPQCIVRYSNRLFFGKMAEDPMAEGSYGSNMSLNMTQFDQTWKSLMNRLLREAAAGSNNSTRKFAVGEENVTDFVKIYGLMQCTPDISETDCKDCLGPSVGFYESHYHGKPGCLIMRPSCMYIWDLDPFYNASLVSISPSLPSPLDITKGKGHITSRTVIIIAFSVLVFAIGLVAFTCVVVIQRRKTKKEIISKQDTEDGDEIDDVESLQFDFNAIRAATNDFSDDSKLGQGGFGVVYKGRLPGGQDIAVKRLSRDSRQGEVEFKNEVLLVAKLQHRNLIRLLGFCLRGNERLLIYELALNSSLDNFIFGMVSLHFCFYFCQSCKLFLTQKCTIFPDPVKRLLLDWETRYKIIGGIARGLLYLHEDSRFRVVHRDLKASNILLNAGMVPKISDFGMAKLFEMDQIQGDTSRVVGTFGYMAPEYIKHGQFSVKSDVFSFGVLVLEIISGQKNSSFGNEEQAQDLLTYAWRNWNEGTALNLIDPTLRVGFNSEVMRCIHIGLLCVQENVSNRPTMAAVVLMLTSCSLSLPIPLKPAFFMQLDSEMDDLESPMQGHNQNHVQFSLNEASISELEAR